MIHLPTRMSALAVVTAVALSGCAATYRPTPTATPPATPEAARPTAAAACSTQEAVRSYAPPSSVPTDLTRYRTVERIRSRGVLIVGVAADILLLGARNPLNGRIEGFDIDLATLISKAIFGDASGRVEFRAMNAADRIPALQNDQVDLVARAMTITCERWQQIAFSAEYYRAGQKLLVRRGSTAKRLADLKGEKVCAAVGSTNLAVVQKASGVIAAPQPNNSACLVQFQRGAVEAIASDDVILAGMAAQDPYAEVVGEAVTAEPYGLGIKKENVDFVQFSNAVLAQAKADGGWRAAYTKWLGPALGPAPAPPPAVYGR